MTSKSIWDIDDTDSKEPRRTHVIETNSVPSSAIKLHNNVVKGCQTCGLSKPNKVQLQVLSQFAKLAYPNLIIIAPPRSGKTSSTVIGILDNFSRATSKYSLAIILCPTYEVAEMYHSCCQILAKFCDVFLYFTAKGKRMNKYEKRPKEIVIGTPDKILELSRSSVLEVKKASFVVIDEADCLGNPKKFFSDISQIFQQLSPRCCRSILCAVSKNKDIDDFMTKHIYSPIEVSVTDTIFRQFPTKQLYLVCNDEREKMESVAFLIEIKKFRGKVIIFTETKEIANELGLFLNKNNILNALLTGDLSVPQRKEVIRDFKTSTVQVLITTRSFVGILPAGSATKLIHFDQILDEKDRLDLNVYKRRDYLLSTNEKNLVVYYVEKRWEEYLFKDKDVTNKKSYFNNIEILNYQKLEDYFD